MQDLRYPIGKPQIEPELTPGQRLEMIERIAQAPAELRAVVAGLSDAQLDTPYRDGGWTVRQVVHHVPDSHMNAYVRFRLALTEDEPTIKPYAEARWAELADARALPLEPSLQLLDALHERWVALVRSMTPEQFARGFVHPEHQRRASLDQTLQLYAWHGRHHVAHVRALRERMGW